MHAPRQHRAPPAETRIARNCGRFHSGRSRTRTRDLFLIRGAQAVIHGRRCSDLPAKPRIWLVVQVLDGTAFLGSGFHAASMPPPKIRTSAPHSDASRMQSSVLTASRRYRPDSPSPRRLDIWPSRSLQFATGSSVASSAQFPAPSRCWSSGTACGGCTGQSRSFVNGDRMPTGSAHCSTTSMTSPSCGVPLFSSGLAEMAAGHFEPA